jgi:hypothetical protein
LEAADVPSVVVGIGVGTEGGIAGVQLLAPDDRFEPALMVLGRRMNLAAAKTSFRVQTSISVFHGEPANGIDERHPKGLRQYPKFV